MRSNKNPAVVYSKGMSGPIFRRPSIHVHKGSAKNNYLLIGDLHLCLQHPKALNFLKEVQALYSIPDSNCISLGDIIDLWGFSRWGKNPDAPISARQEIEAVREELKKWVKAFPKLLVTQGNHDNRILKKALEAELPSQLIKSLHEIFEIPKSWEFHECVAVNTKHPFLCVHGDGHGISNSAPQTNPRHFGMSVAYGHHHSRVNITHINTLGLGNLWSFHVGCLIDPDSFGFEYGFKSAFRASLGCGVVLGDGSTPIFIPLIE